MSETAEKPRSLLIEGQTLITTETVTRPVEERPAHDTVSAILAWLVGAARRNATCARAIDEFGWRLLAANLPVLRVTLSIGTVHPQFLGATYVWWRTTGQTQEIMITHELGELIPYRDNPVLRVREGGETLRRKLDVAEEALDFPILHDLKERGATDYLAVPIASPYDRRHHMATYVTDRPGGFSDDDIAYLMLVSEPLSVVADWYSERFVAQNVLNAYLGPKTGPKVLAGQIRRGTGEEIAAVLWSSDLRGFTQFSDHLPGAQVIAVLDAVFDEQAKAIESHGGEILKFIGDGLLAIFPVENRPPADAAAAALAASVEAQVALDRLSREGLALRMVVALHFGTVIYGNIGAARRLDFTVIGPAVNLVSRVEAVAKALDLPIVVSDDFARVYGRPLTSLGFHRLRGLDQAHELFAPHAAGNAV